MAETIDQRIERLSQETGGTPSPSGTSKKPDDVQRELDQDMGYQLSTGPERVLARKQAFERYGLTPPMTIARPGTKELDTQGPVHTYVRPALELGGMITGGTLGATLPPPLMGPIGGTIGGTLGYAAGDTLASLLERVAGERPPVESVEQALGETGRAVTGGGAIEMVSRGASRIAGALGSKVLAPFAKQYEGANKTLDELAQSKGITLDPYEVIQSRPLALGHKVLENIPFTSGQIQRNELVKLEALTKEWNQIRDSTGTTRRQRLGDIGQRIQDLIDRNLDKIGVRQGEIRDTARDTLLQSAGSPLTYRELGEQTQKAITEKYQGLKDVEDLAWEAAKGAVSPDARVTPTALPTVATRIEKDYENLPAFTDENLLGKLKNAKGSGNKRYDAIVEKVRKDIPAGLPPALRQKLIDEQVAASGEKPGWTVKDLTTLRSELSALAAEHHSGIQRGAIQKGSSDTYGKIYNELKAAIDEDIDVFGRAQGSDVADLFAAARATTGTRKGLFNAKEHPGVARAIKTDPATIAGALIKPGTAAGYTELHALVGPEASQPVKQAFTNQLLGVGGKEADGLPGLRRRLDQYGRQTIEEVYTPQEVKNLYHLADQSTWMKHSPIGNPFFRELQKTAPREVANVILGHPNLTAKYLRQYPHQRGELRAAFVESIHPNQETPFPTQMLKHLNAYPADVQTQLFSQAEIREFYDLANIVDRTKGTVKLAENPSGTAQNLVTFATGGAILKHPITMAPTILTTSMLTKLYLSKAGRKYLLEGLVTPTSSSRSTYIMSQIFGVAGVDMARDLEDQQRIRRGLTRSAAPQLEPGTP